MCPIWNIDQPPLATAYIASQLKTMGHDVTCYDLSIELFRNISEDKKIIIAQEYFN